MNNLKNVRIFLLMAIEWLFSIKSDLINVYTDGDVVSVDLKGLNITIKRS